MYVSIIDHALSRLMRKLRDAPNGGCVLRIYEQNEDSGALKWCDRQPWGTGKTTDSTAYQT